MGVGLGSSPRAVYAGRSGSGSDIELLGSYWTIAGGALPHTDKEYSPFDFKDRVEAMARVGFKGMGLWHADLDYILRTRSLKEMRQIFEDNDIRHVELEFLLDWFLDGEKRKASDRQRAKLLDAAEALGARHVKVGDFFNTPVEMEQLIESWAGLCDDAASAGTRIAFELMPFSMVNTLEDTMTMLEGANADNGGIILDTWHMVKMKVPWGRIARIPKRFVLAVELNDGYIETPEGIEMGTEATDHRKLCGEGEFDVPGFIAAVQKTGYDGPWGIEVLSAEMREWSLEKIVNRSYETTMAQFEIVRS